MGSKNGRKISNANCFKCANYKKIHCEFKTILRKFIEGNALLKKQKLPTNMKY